MIVHWGDTRIHENWTAETDSARQDRAEEAHAFPAHMMLCQLTSHT